MTFETYFKARDVHNRISMLIFAKEQSSMHYRLMSEEMVFMIFDRLFTYEKDIYEYLLQEINAQVSKRLNELEIELESL